MQVQAYEIFLHLMISNCLRTAYIHIKSLSHSTSSTRFSIGHVPSYIPRACQISPNPLISQFFPLETCADRCQSLKSCVQCWSFGTGPLSLEECQTQCTALDITMVDNIDEASTCHLVLNLYLLSRVSICQASVK